MRRMLCGRLFCPWKRERDRGFPRSLVLYGAPGAIRTPDPQIRSFSLYFWNALNDRNQKECPPKFQALSSGNQQLPALSKAQLGHSNLYLQSPILFDTICGVCASFNSLSRLIIFSLIGADYKLIWRNANPGYAMAESGFMRVSKDVVIGDFSPYIHPLVASLFDVHHFSIRNKIINKCIQDDGLMRTKNKASFGGFFWRGKIKCIRQGKRHNLCTSPIIHIVGWCISAIPQSRPNLKLDSIHLCLREPTINIDSQIGSHLCSPNFFRSQSVFFSSISHHFHRISGPNGLVYGFSHLFPLVRRILSSSSPQPICVFGEKESDDCEQYGSSGEELSSICYRTIIRRFFLRFLSILITLALAVLYCNGVFDGHGKRHIIGYGMLLVAYLFGLGDIGLLWLTGFSRN